MTNDQIKMPEEETGVDVPEKPNKLIMLDSENTSNGGKARDINVKITTLEDSLTSLQTELDQINQSVETGLDRLGSNDLDLTAKVSETYKRLGEIDNTYKSLSAISSNIESEVNKLTHEIGDVASQSAAELENLKNSTHAKNNELNAQHRELVDRVNALVANSKETHERLEQSIQKNTAALLKLEQELVEEIEQLASTTQQRDDELAGDIDSANREIEAGKARILKMQEIDEALAKRAEALEATTAELTEQARLLNSSVELLKLKTGDLQISVDRLYALSNAHASLIGDLQKGASKLGVQLLALADTEKLHFRMVSGGLVLALLAIAVVYFYNQTALDADAQLTAERTAVVDQQLSNLNGDVTAINEDISGINTDVAVTNDQLAGVSQELQAQLNQLNLKVEQEVSVINEKMLGMDDQVQSLDGRLDRTSPFSQFGKDNIIHGPHWLKQQNASLFAIEVAVVNDRKALYDIAQRYRRHLKDDLAYYTLVNGETESYVLVLGNYVSSQQADAIVYRMPRFINDQRPAITRIGDIQSRI